MIKRLKVLVFGEIGRYLIAGSIAFVADILILNLLRHYFDLHYLIANTGGFAVGLFVSYLLNIKWVFADRQYGDDVKVEFPIFVAIVAVGYLISQAVMWLFVEGAALDVNLAKAVSSIFVMAFNFTAKKILLFTKVK